jgi:hypothetical protein
MAHHCRTVRFACAMAIALTIPLVVSAALSAAAPAPAKQRLTGAFSGTGRACYGKLFVRTETIEWLTPFSQCPRVRYRIVDDERDGNARAVTFELDHRAKGCRYGVIHLRHRDEPDPAIGWEVFGYATLDDYRQDRARGFKAESPTSMVCYLVADEPRSAP